VPNPSLRKEGLSAVCSRILYGKKARFISHGAFNSGKVKLPSPLRDRQFIPRGEAEEQTVSPLLTKEGVGGGEPQDILSLQAAQQFNRSAATGRR
jgi:hypothetical protein